MPVDLSSRLRGFDQSVRFDAVGPHRHSRLPERHAETIVVHLNGPMAVDALAARLGTDGRGRWGEVNGAHRPELDGATDVALVRDARFFADHRETVEAQGGDYRRALAAGEIGAGHILAEVGEVLAGRHPGRESDEEITLYKSVGLAAYDLAAGQAALRAALAEGAGVEVDLGD